MSYENRSLLKELHLITVALEAGAKEQRLSHFLSLSVDATLEAYTDMLRSAPSVVLPYRLLITVNATGELTISELLTSMKLPGASSPPSSSPAASSQSPSDRYPFRPLPQPREESPSRTLDFPTQRSPDKQHQFEGMVTRNCIHCNMPMSANQHPPAYIYDGKVTQVRG